MWTTKLFLNRHLYSIFSVSSVAYSSFIGKQGYPKTKPLPFSDDDTPMSQSITTTERWVEGGMFWEGEGFALEEKALKAGEMGKGIGKWWRLNKLVGGYAKVWWFVSYRSALGLV